MNIEKTQNEELGTQCLHQRLRKSIHDRACPVISDNTSTDNTKMYTIMTEHVLSSQSMISASRLVDVMVDMLLQKASANNAS